MRSIKSQAKAAIEQLPDDCSMEDIQYRLYVLEKIRRGIKQDDEGATISHAELLKRVKKWRAR